MAFPNLIHYFRDCYEADNRRTTIWNIFHPGVEHRIFMDGREDLITGFVPLVPVDVEQGNAIKKAAYLHRREKDLLYCSLFIVGWVKIQEGATQAICAPLLFNPAEIIEQDSATLVRLDPYSRQLNHRLIDCMQDSDEGAGAVERLAEILGADSLTFDRVVAGAEILESLARELDCGATLNSYPRLISEGELSKAFSASKADPSAGLRLLPASVLALVKKSAEIRGVLNELSEIAQIGKASEPLQVLLGNFDEANRALRRGRVGRVPAVLSHAQTEIVRKAGINPVTLVNGPPGTGKSYTIAALAMEHLSQGRSVLIASKTNHAVDVIGTKIEDQLGLKACVVRGGRKQYLKDLKLYLQQLLSGMYTVEPVDRKELARLRGGLTRLDRSIDRLERRITELSRREVVWGRLLAGTADGFLAKLNVRYVHWRARRVTPLWVLVDLLERQLAERIQKTRRLIQLLHRARLHESLRRHRTDFNRFLAAIRARTGGKQEDLFNIVDFKALIGAFPVWLSNLSDIHEVLPLRRELFDLAIIDEATQCDIASSLPILQRARRVVIVGDPHQLRHLSFLSKARQQSLITRHEVPAEKAEIFDYRSKSILDLASETLQSQDHVGFLDEHYRSAQPIIAFSNTTFYGGALRVMTDRPGEMKTNRIVVRRAAGERGPSGANEAEARMLIEDVERQLASESHLGEDLCHSIGILSPFRSQADYIYEQLAARLPFETFNRHDVLIGTAHTFQGEERDLMFVSFAVGPKAHASSLRYLEKPDVFNVSITRARARQHIYVSIDPERLEPGTLLASYLRFAGGSQHEVVETPNAKGGVHQDRFSSIVAAQLDRHGFRTWMSYPVAGLTMDLIATKEGRSCGIDLVGYPGDSEAAFPIERYKMFYRAGLKIVPLSYSRWLLDMDRCLQAVEAAVEPAGTTKRHHRERSAISE